MPVRESAHKWQKTMLTRKVRCSQISCRFSSEQSGWEAKGEPGRRWLRTSKFEGIETYQRWQGGSHRQGRAGSLRGNDRPDTTDYVDTKHPRTADPQSIKQG